MRPAASVILLTTLAGAGQGLFLALYLAHALYGLEDAPFYVPGMLGAGALAALGLVASVFHLGNLKPAWRAASQWRTSWLSREVIVLPAFIAGCLACAAARRGEWALEEEIGLATVAVTLLLYLCTGMIYACLKFLREWATWLTPLNFALLGSASGFTLAAALVAHAEPAWFRFYAHGAIAITLVALAFRVGALRRNARLRPAATVQSAIGVAHPKVAQKSMGFTGGSFNTREFFHGRTAQAVRAVKWSFLLLAFAAPVLLLVSQLDAPAPLVASLAFAVQYAGLLAERWYFFAEVNHPQNLYYQAMS